MKITKNQLKQIIKEELDTVITQEGLFDMFRGKDYWAKNAKVLPSDGKILQQIADLQAAGLDIDVPTEQELATMRVGDSKEYYALKNQLLASPGAKPRGTSKLIQTIHAFMEKQSDADYARKDAADDKARASAAAEKKRGADAAAAKAAEENHWTNSETFVHPDNRGPVDQYEKAARRNWREMMDKRKPGDRAPFPGDVKGGVGYEYRGRTYGGKY